MRLLKFDSQGRLSLTDSLIDDIPPYAILSHTWGRDVDEVTFADLQSGVGHTKPGYAKIQFCGQQAKRDEIDHFWIDTCCIDKSNNTELSEAIVSMFRWYRDAKKCYVYLSDVSNDVSGSGVETHDGASLAFRGSRWFKRGWTLQELLAPKKVEFFSRQQTLIGTKESLLRPICEVTGIAAAALQGAPLSHYSVSEKMQWAVQRQTKKTEDKAYCLFGIFDVFLPLIYGEGDNAFFRLREAIDKQLNASQTSNHAHWCVPRPANALFTGRRDVLEDLEHLIREYMTRSPGEDQCRIVISGIGGQGKSEICLQLARRLRNRFWAVLWVDVSTQADAQRSYLDVAQKLSVPAGSWEDARHNIANLKHPWLMFLDNAGDLSIDYSIYFPEGNPGVIILTSRNDECQHYASTANGSILLDGLAIRDAQDLLLKAAGVPQTKRCQEEREAGAVAKLLQSHALALVQAGAYVFNGHCTLSEYPRMYERRRQRLLGFRPKQAKSRYGDVYTTFEVSAEILKDSKDEAARDALQLLPMLAVCGPTRFPVSLFETAWRGVQDYDKDCESYYSKPLTSWHASRLPAFLNVADTEYDSFRLREAIQLLRKLSLITVDSEGSQTLVSMHALVHAWARDRQSPEEMHASWLQMGCVIAFGFRGDNLPQWLKRQLQSHCEAMTLWDMEQIYGTEPPELVTQILVIYGWILRHNQSDAHLVRFVQMVMQHLGLSLSLIDERWVSLYALAATSFMESNRIDESKILLENILQIQNRKFPEEHPSRLDPQYQLAYVLLADGQESEAVALLEQVVEVRQRVLGKEIHALSAAQHMLACAYEANGQTTEAINLFKHVVEVDEQILGEDNQDRLTAQYRLAMAYDIGGQTKEAVTLLEHVVETMERTLPETQRLRLTAKYNLARLSWKLGRHDMALVMMTEVVQVQEHSLPNSYRHRQNAENWLRMMQTNISKIKANSPSENA